MVVEVVVVVVVVVEAVVVVVVVGVVVRVVEEVVVVVEEVVVEVVVVVVVEIVVVVVEVVVEVDWLVDCFGFSGPLRQYFSLYRAVSQREVQRGERIEESKNVQTTPTRTYCKRKRPLPYYYPNCRTPRH